jgi:hypothetical protein
MQLEEYFEFQRPDDIRINGTRVGIESILTEYVCRQRTPEEIAEQFPTVSLEQVYATILYYLANRAQVGGYLHDHLEWVIKVRQEAEEHPSPAAQRLRALRAEIEAYPPEDRDAARSRIVARERAGAAESEQRVEVAP